MNRRESMAKILFRGFLPNIIHDDLPVVGCVEQILAAGLEAVEVSCRRPDALALVGTLKKEFPGLVVAVSSLVDDGPLQRHIVEAGHPLPTVQQAIDAGADALVSIMPFRERTYLKYGRTHLIIPGIATLGEGHQALDWGANLLKFSNPGLTGGPAFFKGIEVATHRSMPYCVTGGMRPETVPSYVETNVLVFIAGFDLILGNEYPALRKHFSADRVRMHLDGYVRAVATARAEHQPRIPFASKDAEAIAAACGRCLNLAEPGEH